MTLTDETIIRDITALKAENSDIVFRLLLKRIKERHPGAELSEKVGAF